MRWRASTRPCGTPTSTRRRTTARSLPAGLTDEQRQRIEDAAVALADPAVVAAFDGVQQQAKDVCHTPLSL